MSTLRKLTNNVKTMVAVAYQPGDPGLTVVDGSGFPSLATDEWFCVSTFTPAQVPISILKISAVTGNVLTVDSAIEGTTDVSMRLGTIVAMVPTAGTVMDLYGGSIYSKADATTISVGGIPSGTLLTNQTISQVFDQLFYPYQHPAFTSFSISGSTSVEVGATLSGSHTFLWGTSNAGNVAANSIGITDTTNSQTLATGLANTGSHAVSINVTKTTATSNTWTINGTDTEAIGFAGTASVSWLWQRYYGTSASPTLDSSGIQGLTGALATTFAATYPLPAANYKYISFPDSFGSPAAFFDASTGFQVAMATGGDDAFFSHTANGFAYGLVSVANGNGATTTYRVYRTKNALGGALNLEVS